MTEDQRVFVCTNQKSGVGDDVAKALKKEVKAQHLKKHVIGGQKLRVRIQTCNCLDVCKSCKKGSGAALVVYPEGTLYGNVKPADAAELVEDHIGRGRVVARLLVKER